MRKQKLSMRDKMALKTVEWLRERTIKSAKQNMKNIYLKNEEFIHEINEKAADLIELEEEKNHPAIVSCICSGIISGFEKEKEAMLIVEMIKETLKNYYKNLEEENDTEEE